MSLTRIAAAVTLAGAISVSGGCGGTTDSPAERAQAPSVTPTPTLAVETPTPTPILTPTPTPTPSPTRTAKATPTAAAQGGDGGADGVAGPATAGGGVCSRLSTAQVGAVLGVAVSGAAVPGQTGCKFSQGGKRGVSVTVLDRTAAEAGGMAGAKSEANSAVEGEPEDLPGIGSAAFVVTGAMFGGPDVNAAGAVQVGSRIISVYLEQGSALGEPKVRSLEIDLLKLVVRARTS